MQFGNVIIWPEKFERVQKIEFFERGTHRKDSNGIRNAFMDEKRAFRILPIRWISGTIGIGWYSLYRDRISDYKITKVNHFFAASGIAQSKHFARRQRKIVFNGH